MKTTRYLYRIDPSRRLPEDSGEWRSVPLKFRSLPARTESLGRHRAHNAVALLLAVSCHIAVLAGLASLPDMLLPAVVLPVTLPGTVLGLLWISQFRQLTRQESINSALLWTVVALHFTPLLGWMTFFVAVVGLVPWLLYACLGAIVTHRVLGGRP